MGEDPWKTRAPGNHQPTSFVPEPGLELWLLLPGSVKVWWKPNAGLRLAATPGFPTSVWYSPVRVGPQRSQECSSLPQVHRRHREGEWCGGYGKWRRKARVAGWRAQGAQADLRAPKVKVGKCHLTPSLKDEQLVYLPCAKNSWNLQAMQEGQAYTSGH